METGGGLPGRLYVPSVHEAALLPFSIRLTHEHLNGILPCSGVYIFFRRFFA
jgi:hypothetical protein